MISKPHQYRDNFFGSSKSPTYENLRNHSSLSKFNSYNRSKKLEERNGRNQSADKYGENDKVYKELE